MKQEIWEAKDRDVSNKTPRLRIGFWPRLFASNKYVISVMLYCEYDTIKSNKFMQKNCAIYLFLANEKSSKSIKLCHSQSISQIDSLSGNVYIGEWSNGNFLPHLRVFCNHFSSTLGPPFPSLWWKNPAQSVPAARKKTAWCMNLFI